MHVQSAFEMICYCYFHHMLSQMKQLILLLLYLYGDKSLDIKMEFDLYNFVFEILLIYVVIMCIQFKNVCVQ